MSLKNSCRVYPPPPQICISGFVALLFNLREASNSSTFKSPWPRVALTSRRWNTNALLTTTTTTKKNRGHATCTLKLSLFAWHEIFKNIIKKQLSKHWGKITIKIMLNVLGTVGPCPQLDRSQKEDVDASWWNPQTVKQFPGFWRCCRTVAMSSRQQKHPGEEAP